MWAFPFFSYSLSVKCHHHHQNPLLAFLMPCCVVYRPSLFLAPFNTRNSRALSQEKYAEKGQKKCFGNESQWYTKLSGVA